MDPFKKITRYEAYNNSLINYSNDILPSDWCWQCSAVLQMQYELSLYCWSLYKWMPLCPQTYIFCLEGWIKKHSQMNSLAKLWQTLQHYCLKTLLCCGIFVYKLYILYGWDITTWSCELMSHTLDSGFTESLTGVETKHAINKSEIYLADILLSWFFFFFIYSTRSRSHFILGPDKRSWTILS